MFKFTVIDEEVLTHDSGSELSLIAAATGCELVGRVFSSRIGLHIMNARSMCMEARYTIGPLIPEVET